MATARFINCSTCGRSRDKRRLFQALKRCADQPDMHCTCGSAYSLELEFDFGLGASDKHSTVAGVFLPKQLESWHDKNGSEVTFYPFLVVLNRSGRERAIWLPYWHLVARDDGRRAKEKYGQWAPFMDAHLFESLLGQARVAGLIDR